MLKAFGDALKHPQNTLGFDTRNSYRGTAIRSPRKRFHSFAGRWSSFDPLCAAIYHLLSRMTFQAANTVYVRQRTDAEGCPLYKFSCIWQSVIVE